MGNKAKARQKGMHNRAAARYAGRTNAATVQYHEHMKSATIGQMIPITRYDLVAHLTNNKLESGEYAMIMPDKGYQIPEQQDQVLPLARVAALQGELMLRGESENARHQLSAPQIFARVWASHKRQGLDLFHFVEHDHPEYGKVRHYFSGLEHFFVLVRTKYIRISIVYKKWEVEKILLLGRNIIWTERRPLPELLLPPQPRVARALAR